MYLFMTNNEIEKLWKKLINMLWEANELDELEMYLLSYYIFF